VAQAEAEPVELSLWSGTSLIEAAVEVKATSLLPGLIRHVDPFAKVLAQFVGGATTDMCCPGRFLGEAAALLNEAAEARGYYDQALEVCQRTGHRPEIALIRFDLAELLLEHHPDERDAAIEHLDFAIAELRDMKMQPALERALRHRGLLKA
jgi:hypothetical protein